MNLIFCKHEFNSVKWFRLVNFLLPPKKPLTTWFFFIKPDAPANFIQPIVTIKRAHYPEVVGDYVVCGQSDFVPKFRMVVNDNLIYEIARNLHVEPGPKSEQNDNGFVEVTLRFSFNHKNACINRNSLQ